MEHPSGNTLFPIFLRPDKLRFMVIGGGTVGLEKVGFMFKHAPGCYCEIITLAVCDELVALQKQFPQQIEIVIKAFEPSDLKENHVVIGATNVRAVNEEIYHAAKAKGLIVNVADTPDLCDFYLSSVVKKGDLKIAISSNGKSPTLTKRIREFLEEALPDNLPAILDRLKDIRNDLKGDFQDKVKQLDELTSVFKNKQS